MPSIPAHFTGCRTNLFSLRDRSVHRRARRARSRIRVDYTTIHGMRPAAANEGELLVALRHVADANINLGLILEKLCEFGRIAAAEVIGIENSRLHHTGGFCHHFQGHGIG